MCENKWNKVEDCMPNGDEEVLVTYKNSWGKDVVLLASHYDELTAEAPGEWDPDDCAYNEVDDTYYIPEGWYEACAGSEELYGIDGTVSHWMPIPRVPWS